MSTLWLASTPVVGDVADERKGGRGTRDGGDRRFRGVVSAPQVAAVIGVRTSAWMWPRARWWLSRAIPALVIELHEDDSWQAVAIRAMIPAAPRLARDRRATMRILAVSLALAGLVVADPAAAVDRLVDDGLTPCTSGPIPIHATIGDAVAAATDGETILVCSGTYSEHVVVDKTVQLQAQGLVSLVSPGTAGSGFLVTGPDVVIEGFDVSGYTLDSDCGIRVLSGAGADIGDNRVHGNRSGLCVEQTAGAAVHNNVAEANAIDGIFVAASAVVVSANATRDNGRWGINAVACTARLQISRNLVVGNDGGGILANNCTGAGIVANTVRGDNQPGAHGIMATGGEGVSVGRNLVQFSDIGLLLQNQDTCVASFNSISFNDVGIELRSSSGCRITRNNVSRSRTIDCRWDGIPGTIFSANSCGTEIPPGAWD